MILLLLGRILQIALAVVQIRLATTLLNPGQYGTWVLLQTVVGFVVMFLISPLGLYLNRHVNSWDKTNHIPEVFRGYTILLFAVSLLGSVFFFVVQKLGWVNLHLPSMALMAIIMAVFMLAQTFHQTWVPTLNFLGKRKEFVLGTSLATFLSLSMVMVFKMIGWNSPEAWAVSFSLGYILSTFMFIPRNWYDFSTERFGELKKSLKMAEVFQFSWPLLLSTLFIWFQTQGYRFIVESKVGLATFGQFAAGYAVVAGLFSALETVVISFYQPKLYKGITEGSMVVEELKSVWNITLYPYVLAAVFLFILAPDIARLFLHGDFLMSTKWISWVVLAEGARVLFNVVCINYHATKKTLSIAWPHFIGAVVTVGCFLFIQNLTYLNLLIALCAGYAVSTVILIAIDHKNFLHSRFFIKLMTSSLFGAVFFLLSFFIAKYSMGITRIIGISLLGCLFMTPYYSKHVRGTA